jgi:hypothetical protein
MSSNRIEIFKKASNSLKISFKKKSRIHKKKASWQLPHCHNGQFAPGLTLVTRPSKISLEIVFCFKLSEIFMLTESSIVLTEN